MDRNELVEIIERCAYPGVELHLGTHPEGRDYLQVRALLPDSVTGKAELQSGRKWDLSPHMCANEVVNTAFLAVEKFEEHERRERFMYRGRTIYAPHFSPEALVAFCDQGDVLEARAPAPIR